jgi:hypothetical protein
MSIDTLKSTISKRGGLAKANRFNLIFSSPASGIFNLSGGVLSSWSSGGGAGTLINDPRDISLLAENVTLPGRQISTIDYNAEKQTVKIPYGVINEDVTATFLLTNDYYIKSMFDDWLKDCFDVENYRAKFKDDFAVDVVIQQLNEKNLPVYGVRLEKAFPTTVASITLDNNSESTVQKLSVTFSYENYVPEGLLSSTRSAIRSAKSVFDQKQREQIGRRI